MATIQLPDGAGGYTVVTQPERSDFDQNLNGALQYTFAHTLYKILDVMGSGLARFFGSFAVEFLNILEPEILDFVGPLLDQVLGNPELPPELRHYFQKIRDGESQAGAALAGALGSSAASAGLLGVLEPVFTLMSYIAFDALPVKEFDVPTTLALMWRGHYNEDVGRRTMERQGFRPWLSEALEETIRPRTTVPDWIQWIWRHPEDTALFIVEMNKRGFPDADITKSLELTHLIPGPGDLITMAVREAWRDDVAAKYGLDQDYVQAFEDAMETQGFDPEWSKRWWRAHWQLPSIGQAREMLWRTSMNIDDYREYLRFADVPQTWRGWMSETAYRTLTRVDIRRIHAMGVIDDDDLIKAYTDFGYNSENAAIMAAFTIQYNTSSDRDITKTDILRGYRLGVLSRAEADAALVALGYSEGNADYYLALEEYKYAEELAEEEIGVVKKLYEMGEIDRGAAESRLSAVGLTSERIARLFEIWDIARRGTVDRPTKTELERMLKQDVIDTERYRSEMVKRGYSTEYIDWYYASIVHDQETTARLEEERAAKEAQRIADDEDRTEYTLAKANLDYQIAQERLHLQQVKTAVTLYTDKDRVEALMASIKELQRDIAALGVVIADKRTAIRTSQAALRELAVSPELAGLYTQIDALNIQITERDATVADLRVVSAEAAAAVRVARLPAAVGELTQQIAGARAQIAIEQEIIAGLRVIIAESQQALTRLDIPEEVQVLYTLVDQAQIAIAQQRAEQASLRVDLVISTIAASWEAPAADIEAVREQIDTLEISVRVDQEDVAELRLQIAEIKAEVAGMLDSEEIAELEADMARTQERIRELEIDRARLRITYA